MKMKNQTKAEFTGVLTPDCFFQKEPFWPIFMISKFSKPEIFVIFCFHQNLFFSELQNYFCSTKKCFGSAAQKFAKILTCFFFVFFFFFFFFFWGGGVEKSTLFPPPPSRKKIVDFARIVVKRWRFQSVGTWGKKPHFKNENLTAQVVSWG